MKNKNNTYILLTLVLVVWGLIAYRVFSALGPEDEAEVAEIAAVSFTPKAVKEQDTFNISSYSRDPFLGTFKTRPKPKKKKVAVVKEETPWPQIRYAGLMGDGNSDESIFFVFINGKQYLLKQNDSMEDIRLIKGDKETVTLSFKGRKKVVNMQ